jgi:peptidoglycan-associated lipoprotein
MVTVEGHCDERGTDGYNKALGERRAEAVKEFLVTLGISSNRLNTISYGEERPIAMGQNEASWAKNRRAQFVIN